jgi:hypothetical protein
MGDAIPRFFAGDRVTVALCERLCSEAIEPLKTWGQPRPGSNSGPGMSLCCNSIASIARLALSPSKPADL